MFDYYLKRKYLKSKIMKNLKDIKTAARQKLTTVKITTALISDSIKNVATTTAKTVATKVDTVGHATLDKVDAVADYLNNNPKVKAISRVVWDTAIGTAQILILIMAIVLVLEVGPAVLLLLI